ncbi:MAG: Ca2+-transporting ATPase [Flavobacterium sp.]|jgi:Ca2+-transporting ATPase
MIQNPYSLSLQSLTKKFETNISKGISSKEAVKRILLYKRNEIFKKEKKSKWKILINQFIDPIIYILAIATTIAFLFQDWLEGIAILIVIIITTAIGFFMELQARQSLEALRKISLRHLLSQVIRDGKITEIKTTMLVPGDVIILERGNVIPADARLILVENLMVKEAALTGESIPVEKQTKELLPINTPITSQNNMVFKGTTVLLGRGKAIVVATGMNTQLGKIQQMAIDAKEERTPLEKKLNKLSKRLIWLSLFFAIFIIISGTIRGNDVFLMLQTGIALAVATIPEGLPIVATIALAHGMLSLSKKKVIIKKLEDVETLGITNVICTDKTGTLTEDELKVQTLVLETQLVEDVNSIETSSFFSKLKQKEDFNTLVLTSILCNDVQLSTKKRHGDTIDMSLLDFAEQIGFNLKSIRNNNPEVFKIPFDATNKRMITAHSDGNNYFVFMKGAFENVIASCDMLLKNGKTELFNTKEEWFKKVDDLTSKGLRVLAFAYKKTKSKPENNVKIEHFIFIGIVGFIDPARKDVKPIIESYKKAGIKVIMATGDHPGTAKKIALDIGLLNVNDLENKIILGSSFQNIEKLSKNEKDTFLKASVFARVTPEQKIAIITFFQKNNNIVGMIGDGINDIPALKKANIGIAMGIRGTDAAREVADIILLDDTFTATELAIKQGRIIFQNIRQFVVYLLSSNFAEILSVGVAATLNLPSPLLPLQILFLNVITDIFPALALGLGKGEKNIMQLPPKHPEEPIITNQLWRTTVIYGITISLAVLGITVYSYFVLKLSTSQINNMGFYTLILAQLLNIFNMPSRHLSFFKNEVTSNIWIWLAIIFCVFLTYLAYITPLFSRALSLIPLSSSQIITIIIFSFSSLVLSQIIKRFGVTI